MIGRMKTIREIRSQLALTQVAFAAAVGVAPSTVFKWEALEVEPTARQLRIIAGLAGLSMDDIDFDAKNRKSRARSVEGTDTVD